MQEWRGSLYELTHGACRGCDVCDGLGCIGEIPGMGGLGSASSFINNYSAWESIPFLNSSLFLDGDGGQLTDGGLDSHLLPEIGVAPMTGVEENMGNPCSEADFHKLLVEGAKEAGILSSIGDGVPDFKLQAGADALRYHQTRGAVFFKPYPNGMLFQRLEWVVDVAAFCGLDIDSYRIVTMSGKAVLEKKDKSALLELKAAISRCGIPFVVKGICDLEGVELVEAVQPDVIVVSNHGGRVLDHQMGSATFLQQYGKRLKNFTGEIWVDGGLRNYSHLVKAKELGANRVLIGRPFIQGTVALGRHGISTVLREQFGCV